jgi:hypothetical protein
LTFEIPPSFFVVGAFVFRALIVVASPLRPVPDKPTSHSTNNETSQLVEKDVARRHFRPVEPAQIADVVTIFTADSTYHNRDCCQIPDYLNRDCFRYTNTVLCVCVLFLNYSRISFSLPGKNTILL